MSTTVEHTNGFAHGAQHTQRGAVVALDGLVAVLHERPDQCGRRVEHSHLRMQRIADENSSLVCHVTHLYMDTCWSQLIMQQDFMLTL